MLTFFFLFLRWHFCNSRAWNKSVANLGPPSIQLVRSRQSKSKHTQTHKTMTRSAETLDSYKYKKKKDNNNNKTWNVSNQMVCTARWCSFLATRPESESRNQSHHTEYIQIVVKSLHDSNEHTLIAPLSSSSSSPSIYCPVFALRAAAQASNPAYRQTQQEKKSFFFFVTCRTMYTLNKYLEKKPMNAMNIVKWSNYKTCVCSWTGASQTNKYLSKVMSSDEVKTCFSSSEYIYIYIPRLFFYATNRRLL